MMVAGGLPEFSSAPTQATCGTRHKDYGGACGPRARFLVTGLGGEAR